jgi:2,4-dienoyl-CoA reductase-like NADH-dependent reductase (Old Yellow Enzyme family)
MKALKPVFINNFKLKNRVSVASMCQYSAHNGNPSKWHYGHLQSLSQSGAGLLMLESTAVSKQGRITLRDLTIINKKNTDSLKNLISHIKSISDIAIGLQISHSGRKGSAEIPWIQNNKSLSKKKYGWKTCAPSAIKRDINWPKPKALDKKGIKKIINEFKVAAIRARNLNLDCLEIHMAHGYLLHQFFSPISNKRNDIYGGSLENRCRLLLEVSKEVRKVWPKNKILGARVNGKDWVKNGSTIEDCVYLVKKLKKLKFNYVCVSSGGIVPKTNITFKPGYQVYLAKIIKKRTGIITRTTGMIKNLNHANRILEKKSADLVNFGRKFINSPLWLIKEYKKHNIKLKVPFPYERCF